MTELMARKVAQRLAQRNPGEVVYVVVESGQYDAALDEDIDTYYAGIRPENILYSVDRFGRVDGGL